MLSKVRPKARYMSEMHIEDNVESLMKEIVNGDIEIPKERENVDELIECKDY